MITKKQLNNNLEIAKQIEKDYMSNGFKLIEVKQNKFLSSFLFFFTVLSCIVIYTIFDILYTNEFTFLNIMSATIFSFVLTPFLILFHEYGHMIALNINDCFLLNIHRTFCKKEKSKSRFCFALIVPFFLVFIIIILTILIYFLFNLNSVIFTLLIMWETGFNTIGLYSDFNTYLYIQKKYKNNNVLIATSAQPGKILVKEIE